MHSFITRIYVWPYKCYTKLGYIVVDSPLTEPPVSPTHTNFHLLFHHEVTLIVNRPYQYISFNHFYFPSGLLSWLLLSYWRLRFISSNNNNRQIWLRFQCFSLYTVAICFRISANNIDICSNVIVSLNTWLIRIQILPMEDLFTALAKAITLNSTFHIALATSSFKSIYIS